MITEAWSTYPVPYPDCGGSYWGLFGSEQGASATAAVGGQRVFR